jgi:hypothetical protein
MSDYQLVGAQPGSVTTPTWVRDAVGQVIPRDGPSL